VLKHAVLKLLPRQVREAVNWRMEQSGLAALPTRACRAEHLSSEIPAISDWPDWPEWPQVAAYAGLLGARAGAVNLGDRRAIYSLTRALRPRSVLEVGTHLGGSTMMIALALRHAQRGGRLTTVDILDVNGPKGAWRDACTPPPKQLMADIGCEDITHFVSATSIEFMRHCNERFDLVFLDGNHEAPVVYQEIPLALELLESGGVILMHDVFPDLKPLWSDGSVIPGPVLAMQRLTEEGAPIRIQPLGELPWRTKLGSNVTSLALLLRK
jgi:cephalosporin hydroxylase